MQKFLSNNFIEKIKQRNLGEGERLFSAGDPIYNIYEIIEGQVKMVRSLLDGSEPIVHFIGAGEIVAEASLFSDNYHCHAIAVSDTTLAEFPKDAILQKIKDSGEFASDYIKVLSRQIQSLRMHSELKSIRSAKQRILQYLVLESNDAGVFLIQTSLKNTANRIGLTHETFYRELKSMENNGLITRSEKQINII